MKIGFHTDAFNSAYWNFEKCVQWAHEHGLHWIECGLIDGVSWIDRLGYQLGGVLLAALPEILRHVVEPAQMALFGQVLVPGEVMRLMLMGLAMVLTMLIRPAGLWPAPKHEDRPDADIDAPNKSTDVVAA